MPHWRVFDDINLTSTASPPSVPTLENKVDIRLSHKLLPNYSGKRHEYELIVEIENIGQKRITDFRVDIRFPKAFLDIESYGFEVRGEEWDTHTLLRRFASHFPEYQSGLYPGDVLLDKKIKYAVTSERYRSGYMGQNLMALLVEVAVSADGISQRVTKSIRELQEFGR